MASQHLLFSPGTAVDRSVLAEHFTRTQLTKTHNFTGVRVDSDVGLACGDEKHIVGGIEIANDRLSRLVAPPGTVSLDALQSIRWEAANIAIPLRR